MGAKGRRVSSNRAAWGAARRVIFNCDLIGWGLGRKKGKNNNPLDESCKLLNTKLWDR